MAQGFQGWAYSSSELISNIAFPYMVRLENLISSPLNELQSRQGLEPIHYLINATAAGVSDETQGLLSPTFTANAGEDYFLPQIDTETLALFGDSLIFAGPNASTFHIIPFALGTAGRSVSYEYIAKDLNGSAAPGDARGGYSLYQGYPLFWNGRGTYQVFARSLSESLFTRMDNAILPLEDQTIIGATVFENRLVVITLQGYIMWSQPNWDGVSPWDAAAFERISEDPGEVLDFIGAFLGGLIIGTRIGTKVFGNLYNINSLADTTRTVKQTGVNSFFVRNGVQTSTDNLLGITPQGVLNVNLNQFNVTKAEFEESSPIVQYLNEIFQDQAIYDYLDAFLDPNTRRGYWVLDWSTDRERKSKILTFDYNSKKWGLVITDLPIQRIFVYYGTVCGAGWIRNGSSLVLGIWAFSDVFSDIDITPVQVSGNWYWNTETPLPYKKRMVSGVINLSSTGPNEVPGTSKLPIQVLVRSDDTCDYTIGLRTFTKDAWAGDVDTFNPSQLTQGVSSTENWSLNNSGQYATWNTTKKTHYFHNRHTLPIPNPDQFYQFLFETDSFGDIRISSIIRDKSNKS